MKAFEFGNPNAEIILIQPVDGHDLQVIENEVSVIADTCGKEFLLIAVKIDNWNRDLSPWTAPAVFGKEDFGDGALKTLNKIMTYCKDKSKSYYIGGYSLAGLFSLWASYRTDLFRGVACASPSVWFPDFSEFMKEHNTNSKHIYLSLGDKEEKTRNPVMATVGDKIRTAYNLLNEQGVNCVLEWNEGNHFKDPDLRTAKAFSWIINNDVK